MVHESRTIPGSSPRLAHDHRLVHLWETAGSSNASTGNELASPWLKDASHATWHTSAALKSARSCAVGPASAVKPEVGRSRRGRVALPSSELYTPCSPVATWRPHRSRLATDTFESYAYTGLVPSIAHPLAIAIANDTSNRPTTESLPSIRTTELTGHLRLSPS